MNTHLTHTLTRTVFPRQRCRPRLEALEERAVPSTLDLDWMRTFNGEIRAMTVAGDVFVTGSISGAYPGQTSAGAVDAFVARYSRSGALLQVTQFGTADTDRPAGIAADASGIYVVGTSHVESYVGGHPTPWHGSVIDGFVSRFSLDGALLGTTRLSPSEVGVPAAIAVSGSRLYVAGSTSGASPGEDTFLARLDREGTLLGTTRFGSEGGDGANGIAVSGGMVYVLGSTYGTFPGQTSAGDRDVFVSRLDLGGGLLGTAQFGSTSGDGPVGIAVSGDTVYVTGNTRGTFPSQTNAGGEEVFVTRLGLGGGVLGTTQFGTPDYDDVSSIAADGSGVYVLGRTEGAFPGQTNAGNYDLYVAHLDLAGGLLDITQFGTEDGDFPGGIAVDSTGVYITGHARGTFPGQPVNVPFESGDFVAHLVADRPPLPEAGPDHVAVFAPDSAGLGYGTWYLRPGSDPAAPVTSLVFGLAGWAPVTGDWNGDGITTPGVVDPATATWYLRHSNDPLAPDVTAFPYGYFTWTPVPGDWDGDGTTTVGVVDTSGAVSPHALWYLRNGSGPGAPDIIYAFGLPGWVPVAGDWDGNGSETAGVYDPATGTWYLRLSNDPTDPAVASFRYGWVDWKPVVGDWDGDGIDSIGVLDLNGLWYLRNSTTPGAPDIAPFAFGLGGWKPLAGAWRVPSSLLAAGEQAAGAEPKSGANFAPDVALALARLEAERDPPVSPTGAGAEQAALGPEAEGLVADSLTGDAEPTAALDALFTTGLI
jgi:hypothetical protein